MPTQINNKSFSKNYFYYAFKALLISIVIAIVICLINVFIYKYVALELPENFIYFSAVFTTATATVYAVIAGFTILIAFTRYQDLNNTVAQEINCLQDLLDLTNFIQGQSTIKEQIIKNVEKYGFSVADDEWLSMASGQSHRNASVCLENIIDSVNNITLVDNKNPIVFELLIDRIKDLTTFRADRLSKASEPFPRLLGLILYAISIIFVLSVFFILTPNLLFQSIFLTSITFIAGIVIQLVGDIGNPYKPGVWHVSKKSYETITATVLSKP